ncbi:M20/M25/M40 family metallo-hydrolase [Actinoplanes bogorensis]|uniref:M20/M25/M40 family metallo-hydrolase n=1 Tax=Paractinoplanes bogorensis TaxID=1610840 RepID=A0ABS5Z0N2_9ACTN|nr:M20/M25/M40 family metallo-hydrolase [Actinoplanes bogorensis]MBU2669254.1 M20/M25/M40 family metallo-hydrolase [Actinoplanes bogorensis]
MDRLVEQACELIAIPSTADRPDQLARALDYVLKQVRGDFAVRRFESNGKPSALLHPPGADEFRVILNAHLDVVPGAPEQFVPRVEGDRLYGRGAHDMKVAALVMADVFAELAPHTGTIALQLVTDEEVGGEDGTAHQLAQGVRGGFVVIGEQSGLRIVTESRGLAHVRITARGRAAHAAYPWLGENALLTVTEAVGRLLHRYPIPDSEVWRTTVNVARFDTSNRAVNQVPDEASAWLDIRFPAEDTDFAGRTKEQVAAHLQHITGIQDVTVEALGHPHHADPESLEVGVLRAAARDEGYTGDLLAKHGAADGRHYTAVGVDAVIFGPGGNGQHAADEYADLTTLTPYRNALSSFLQALTTAESPTPD